MRLPFRKEISNGDAFVTAVGRVDVAVVGGGPAGAVTALLLARAGRDVALYEQSRNDALRLGETLPPSVYPLLRKLGLAECGEVDRRRFTRLLIDAAEQAGARVLRRTRVAKVSRSGGGLRIEANDAVSATTVVDATGRTAQVAKTLGANRVRLDKLVRVARLFELGSAPAGDTFIEAAPEGWWYASLLPDQRRIIALFTDAHEIVQSRLATVAGWSRAMGRTEGIRDLASGMPCGRIRVTTTASHELEPPLGDDWIAVGDAAFAVDPLSSDGVDFALRSAAAACDVLLGGDPSVYQRQIAGEACAYRRRRAEIYSWEHRFADAPFWRARRLAADQPLANRAATSRSVGIDGAAPSRSTEQDAAALA